MKKGILSLLVALMVCTIAFGDETESVSGKDVPTITMACEQDSGKMYLEWDGTAPIYRIVKDGKKVLDTKASSASFEMGEGTHSIEVYPIIKTDTLMTVRITNNLMKQYDISEPQLYDTAMENSQRLQKVTCRPMGEVIGDLLGTMDDPEVYEAPAKLYVLSNESLQFGAAALFYPGVIEKIGKSIPEGFYILPSSIHEVLILPKNQGEKAMLENMVQEINETQVAPDEVLSDFVSEYDAQTRTMEWGRDPNLTLPEQLKEKTPDRLPSTEKEMIL